MAEMLVNPDDKRTKREKIQVAGLTERTFYRWIKDERYIAYVNSLVDKFTNSELPDVWKALIRQCKLGDVKAIKLLFDMKGMNPMHNHKIAYDNELLELKKKELDLKDF